jgi:D-alanine-D-alanine ligase
MKIALLVDPESIVPEDPQFEGSYESLLTEVEFHIAETLRHAGHEAMALSFSSDVAETFTQLRAMAPDLIFNLTEHLGGSRQMDFHVAALLDMLKIPYTGSGPEGLMLCRDKGMCKRILSHHQFKVPNFITVPRGKRASTRRLRYPVVVKPVMEDGSDGISLASLVNTEEELRERVRYIHEHIKGAAICEEFIEGRELYVGILGNQRLQALPAREIRFGTSGSKGPVIATARVKQDEAYRKKWNISYTHADLPEALEKRVARVSKRIYRLMKLRDYGRIDLRVTPAGEVYCLEANPNPDLTAGDEIAEAAEKAGIEYDQLISRIVNLALRRYAS